MTPQASAPCARGGRAADGEPTRGDADAVCAPPRRRRGALRRALAGAVTALLLARCVQMPSRPEGRDAAWAWGNFCGRDYPRVEADTPEARRAALEAIAPRDDLDAICKAHDLFCLAHGDHTLRCDDALTRSAYRLRFDGEHRRACARLADQIGRFFACAMPSRGEGIDGLIGALKPLTGMHPLCPGFTHADLWGALRAAPPPGRCVAREAE